MYSVKGQIIIFNFDVLFCLFLLESASSAETIEDRQKINNMTVFYPNIVYKTNCEPNLAQGAVVYKPPPRR